MEIKTIQECTKLSLAGKITFLEVVFKLAEQGIERYIADLVGKQIIAYDAQGKMCIVPMEFNGPSVKQNFDSAHVKEAISNIQKKNINYLTFLEKIMEAGCCHYEVFITGKKAIYLGRSGDQHIEHFPQ